MSWIKLTAEQVEGLEALSATNPTSGYVRPREDVSGNHWLPASILNHGGVFAHYEGLLSTLSPTHENEPTWPASSI